MAVERTDAAAVATFGLYWTNETPADHTFECNIGLLCFLRDGSTWNESNENKGRVNLTYAISSSEKYVFSYSGMNHHGHRVSASFEIDCSLLQPHRCLCLFAVSDVTLSDKLHETKGADFKGTLLTSDSGNSGSLYWSMMCVDSICEFGNFC